MFLLPFIVFPTLIGPPFLCDSLVVRDLSNLVKPEDIITSEHLATLLAVVPKYSQNDWLSCYESLDTFVVSLKFWVCTWVVIILVANCHLNYFSTVIHFNNCLFYLSFFSFSVNNHELDIIYIFQITHTFDLQLFHSNVVLICPYEELILNSCPCPICDYIQLS